MQSDGLSNKELSALQSAITASTMTPPMTMSAASPALKTDLLAPSKRLVCYAITLLSTLPELDFLRECLSLLNFEAQALLADQAARHIPSSSTEWLTQLMSRRLFQSLSACTTPLLPQQLSRVYMDYFSGPPATTEAAAQASKEETLDLFTNMSTKNEMQPRNPHQLLVGLRASMTVLNCNSPTGCGSGPGLKCFMALFQTLHPIRVLAVLEYMILERKILFMSSQVSVIFVLCVRISVLWNRH